VAANRTTGRPERAHTPARAGRPSAPAVVEASFVVTPPMVICERGVGEGFGDDEVVAAGATAEAGPGVVVGAEGGVVVGAGPGVVAGAEGGVVVAADVVVVGAAATVVVVVVGATSVGGVVVVVGTDTDVVGTVVGSAPVDVPVPGAPDVVATDAVDPSAPDVVAPSALEALEPGVVAGLVAAAVVVGVADVVDVSGAAPVCCCSLSAAAADWASGTCLAPAAGRLLGSEARGATNTSLVPGGAAAGGGASVSGMNGSALLPEMEEAAGRVAPT
jgi:hypothetical protein